MRLGPMELIIILVIVLLIFGVGKLPQVGDALGKGLRSFQKASTGEEAEEVKEEKTEKAAEEPKAEAAAKPETVEKPKTETAAKG